MAHYLYSDAEVKEIIGNMVILCDSREQQNEHITKAFDRAGIKHKSRKLDTADYTAMLPALPEYGINRPVCFDNSILIERKASLEELSNNLTNERDRLKSEFTRAKGKRVYMLIENASIGDILRHRYRTRFSEKAFIASLLSLQEEYNINVLFVESDLTAKVIHNLLYYHIRNYLIGGSSNE